MSPTQNPIDGVTETQIMFAGVEYKLSAISDYEEDVQKIADYTLEIKTSLELNKEKYFKYNQRDKRKKQVTYSCVFENNVIDIKGKNYLYGKFSIFEEGKEYKGLDKKDGKKKDFQFQHPPEKTEIIYVFTPDKKLILEKKIEITDIFLERFNEWVSYNQVSKRFFTINPLQDTDELSKVIPTLAKIDRVAFGNLHLPNPSSGNKTIMALKFIQDVGCDTLVVSNEHPKGRHAKRKPKKTINKDSEYLESFLAVVGEALGEVKELVGEKKDGSHYRYIKRGKKYVLRYISLIKDENTKDRIEKMVQELHKAFKK